MVAGPPRSRRDRAGEAKKRQIQLFDEQVHAADEAVLTDPVIQPIREKQRLAAINTLNETRHVCLRTTCGSLPQRPVSTQPRPIADGRGPLAWHQLDSPNLKFAVAPSQPSGQGSAGKHPTFTMARKEDMFDRKTTITSQRYGIRVIENNG